MKAIIHLALLCMAMLMSQSCGGASHKNSDSETENDATEESSENTFGIRFKTIPQISQYTGEHDKQNKWYISEIDIIVCNDSGTPIMYDDEMGETYDSYAFAFFCAKKVADKYFDNWRNELDNFNSETEALNKWESDFAPKIDPYLALCLNMPVDANVCPPLIQDWFNRVYYDYKDKDIYLMDSGYGYRKYQIGNKSTSVGNFEFRETVLIHRVGDEGTLAITQDNATLITPW